MFNQLGIDFVQGYGLTETSPILTLNPVERFKEDSVGKLLPRVEMKILDPDERGIGEIAVKGPMVMQGYYRNEEATREAFTEDGWFLTGDIIEETADGYLVYHDRIKQLIVLDTGKNVAPQPIEDEFATSDRIDQAMVIGDDQKFIAALFVPNFEAIRRWAETEGVDLPDDPAEICRDERVREYINEEVEAVNGTLSKPERIKEFRLVPLEWNPDNDLLTPSMKIKRRNVMDRFEEQVEDIYGED